jgi:hypothetical protein
MIDYKNLKIKEPAMVPRWIAINYAIMAIAAWAMCIFVIDKLG